MGLIAVCHPLAAPLQGATLYWDADGSSAGNVMDGTNLGGSGSWTTAQPAWWDLSAIGLWQNTGADEAVFTGTLVAGVPTAETITLGSGLAAGKLTFLRSGYTLTGGDLTLAGAEAGVFVSRGHAATIESQLSGTDGLSLTGGGALRLANAANNYSGVTSVSNGVLVIGSQGALGADSSAIVVNGSATRGFGGGTLLLDGAYDQGMEITRDVMLQGLGPITDRNAALISVGNNTLSGTITYAGGNVATAVNSVAGMLAISGDVISAGSSATLRFGTVNSVGVGGYRLTGAVYNTGTGGIEKIGGGTLILDQAATLLNGVVNATMGSVRVSNGAALGTSTANGALTIGSSTGTVEIRTNAPASFGTRRVTMSTGGTGTIYLDHEIGSETLNQTVQLSALTLTASSSTRTLVVDGRNGHGLTFSGDSVGGNLGGSNSVTVNANGLVTFDGSFWNNTSTTARTLTLTTGTGARAVITGSVVASGAAHVLTKAGAGTLTLLGSDSTYSGATNVNGGVLAIGGFGSITNNTAVVNIGSTTTAATLEIMGQNLDAGQATTSKVINLAGTTGGATILASQSGTSPALVFNADFTATGSGVKTLTLGGANTADNLINGAIVDSTAATYVVKAGSGTWVLAGANTYTGMTILNEGTLKIQASLAGTSILADAAAVGLKFGSAASTVGTAGGVFQYVGADGAASAESVGALLPGAGSGTVRVTPGAGGTAILTFATLAQSSSTALSANVTGSTTLTVASTAGLEPGMRLLNGSAAAYVISVASATSVVVSANQTLSSGTTLNFGPGSGTVNYVPEAGGSVVFASLAEAGLLSSSSYFNGADFAYAPSTTNAVLRAPVYDTDAGFVTAAAALGAGSHNLVTGNTSTAAATVLSLKIDGAASPVVTQTGLLTIRTGAAGTSGGILVSGGTATIAGTGVTTGGSGDLFIRVDGAGDTLFLNAPITSATTGGLIKTGAGTLVIGAANAQTTGGITQLQEGTIKLAPGGRLSANSVHLYMRQGTTFDLNGVNVSQSATSTSIGMLTGAGTVTNTSATPVIFAMAGSGGVFNGTIDEVNGKISVIKMGTTSTQVFNGLSNYTGSTIIGVPGSGTTGTLSVFYMADIGQSSGLGRGDATDTASNAASLIFGGTTGGLVYTGDASVSTNRLFTLAGTAAAAGATITNNGVNNAALIFSNSNAIAFSGTAAQTLRLGGSSLADNWFHPQITDNGAAATSFVKVGTGLWILGNVSNSYTGTTTLTEGALQAEDGTTLPSASALVLGGGGATTQQSVFQSKGVFSRSLGTGAGAVSWGTGLTAGGSGFAASTDKLTVAIGGLGTETPLLWAGTDFLPAGAALVLNSTTALAEVEFRNAIELNGASRTIVVNENTSTFTDYATITGAITDANGTAGITKSGNGTLQLRGANTYHGVTAVTAGTLIVTSLGHSSDAADTATSLGASGVAFDNSNALTLGNGSTTAGILQYVGQGEISDRLIRLNTTTGSTQIHADGSGPLILPHVLNNMAAGAKSLYLRGSNAMGNMITSSLADNGGALSLVVDGGATWILSGNNTYTGSTTLGAGALGIGSNTAIGTGPLVLSSGSMFAHGGDWTLTNAVTFSTNAPTAFIGEQSLTLAPSGGVFTMTGSTSSLTVTTTNNIAPDKTLTLQGDATSAATAGRTWTINGSGNTVFTGDILTTGASAVSLNYTGNGTLRLSGVNTTGGNTTVNNAAGTLRLTGAGKLGSGNLTVNAGTLLIESVDQDVATLAMGNVGGTSATIDVAAGLTLSPTAITFSGSTTLASTITGGGTLALGSGGITVTIADNATQGADMVWTIANLTGSGVFTKAGAGVLDVSGVTNNNFTGTYLINAGGIQGLGSLTNNLALNGGVYQGAGSFTRSLGTGSNQVQWLPDSGAGTGLGGGFAAAGGNLTVALAGAPSPLVWAGTPLFVPDAAPLMFGSTSADAVTDFTHDIDLNGAVRTISAVDNTAVTTDWAVLSGVLSNGGITKTGNGILLLSGANTFAGTITISSGTLQFSTVSNNGGGPSSLGQGTDGIILSGGRLQFVGSTNQTTDRAMSFTTTGILDASGTGGASITFAGAITAGGNSLNLEGSGDGFLNGLVTTTGTSADLNKNGTGTWTINVAPIIGDNLVISGGTLIFNTASSFDGDDLYIRAATLKLGVNGALTNAMDDFNISTETAGGGVFDINGTTGSSTTDIIIGTNPANPGTTAPLSGSMIDSVGGGSFSSTTLNVRNGVVSANVITTGTTTLGNVFSSDAGGLNTTTGAISGSLTLNTGSSLVLYNGLISGDITFASGITTAKHSGNTVTLSGNNTVAGAGTTTVANGVLVLDHTTNTGPKISDGALTMNGGTLQIDGNASTAVTVTVGDMTLGSATDPAPAVVRINTTGADATLAVGSITRNAGATLRFNPSSSASGHFTTTATNTAGTLLGGWATYQAGSGETLFATVSGGEITGLASTVMDSVAAWSAGADISDGSGFTGTLAAGMSINSLRFNAATGASAITIGASDVLDIASGGILITSNVAAGSLAITGGRITAGQGNELIVTHDGAAPLALSSQMTGTLALTKAGAGLMVLDQTGNTATGTVRISGGTLRLQGGGAVGDRAAVILEPAGSVLLDVVDSETIGSLSGGDSSNTRGMEVRIAAGQSLSVNQSTSLVYYGHISAASGSATFNKTGAGTLTINDGLINLGASGVINVNGGRLAVDVNGSNPFVQSISAGTTVNIGTGASFFIDHNDVSSASGIAGGRIADDVVFNLSSTGSTTDGLYFRDDENISVAEVIGAVNLVSGSNSVRVDSNTSSSNTSQNIVLRAGSITRSNQATLVLRGTGIQSTSSPRAQFQISDPTVAFGTGTGTSLPVIPWAIGPAAGGAAAADTFLTTTGAANAAWRPLNLATEYAIVADVAGWNATTSADNVLVSSSTSAVAGRTVRSLLMAMGTDAVDLGGTGTLTVDSGGFLFSGTGSSTLSGFSGIQVGSFTNEYIFHVVGGSATVSSQLTSATAKLTKSGAGSLILSASNLGLGTVTLNEGALQISDLDNIGGSTGAIVFAGGTLRLDATSYAGDDLSTRTFTLLSGGGTVDTNGNDITFANAIGSGSSGSFTKAGAGALTLNAAVAYTGATVVSGGSLVYGVQDALPASMNVTLAGGTLDFGAFTTSLAELEIAGNSTLTGSAPLTVTGMVRGDGASRTLTVNNSALTTFSGSQFYLVTNSGSARTIAINGTGNVLITSEITNGTGVGSLTYSGSGTLTLTGPLSYTGTTTLNNAAGTLVFSGVSQISGTALTVNAGTAQLNPAYDQTVGNLTLGGGGAGTSATLQIGAGRRLTLAGTVTFSSSGSPLASTIEGGVGAILDFGGVGRIFNVGDSSNAEPDLIIGANVTLVNDGGGGIIKQGSGTLHIAGTNQLTGPVVIEAGAVTGDLGTGNLSLNNGVFEGAGTFTRSLGTGGGQVQWAAGAGGGFAASGGALSVTLAGAPDPLVWNGTPLFVSGAGALIFGSTTADSVVTFTHNLDLNNTASPVTRTITVNDNPDVATDKAVLPGVLGSSGAGAVTLLKNGAGVLELAGANTFSALTLASGTLQFSTVTNIGGGPSNLGQGSAIDITGSSVLSFIGSTSQSTDRPINGTASFTLDASGAAGTTITYTGAITQAANTSLTLSGNGVGAGSITGGITQPAGAASADLIVASGIWTLSGADSQIADDLLVNGGTLNLDGGVTRVNDDTVVTGTSAVLNLNAAGVLAAATVSGTSSGLYARTGGTINLNADDVNGTGNSGGLDFIIVGDSGGPDAAVFNTNTYSISVPRFDVGQRAADLTGVINGSGVINVTGGDINLYAGTVNAALASTGSTALEKFGPGTLVLKGDNSGLGSTGNSIVYEGTLALDYTASNTTKLRTGSALELLGGDLVLIGNASAATSQTVASTTLDGSSSSDNSGRSSITLQAAAGQDIVLNLGAVGRSSGNRDGTIRFVLPSGTQSATHGFVTTTVNGAQGLLGSSGFATVVDGTGTWFATNSTNASGGNIVGLVSTIANDITAWALGSHVTDDGAGFTGTLQSITINSLRFNAAAGSGVNITQDGILGIASGGILVTDQAGGSPGIHGGTLVSGVNELIITQDSAQVFEISADIRLSQAVTKTGAGTLRLSGNNTYGDETDIQEGTLQVSGGNAIGDNSIVTLNAFRNTTLELLDDEVIGRLSGGQRATNSDNGVVAVGAHSLTINQTSNTTYAGFFTGAGSIVVQGVGNLALTNASSGFTGTLIVNDGSLVLNNIGQISASVVRVVNDGSLLIDNNGTTRSGARLLDTTPVILESADGGFAGQSTVRGLAIRTDQGATTNEKIGDLTFGSGANYLSGETTNSSGTGVASIQANDFIRSNNATVNVRARSLGQTSGNRNQFLISTAANETAFIGTLVGGGGTAGSTNISIVPWAVGESTSGALTAANMGNSLLTYVAGAGFRPLLTTEYSGFSGAAAADNVRESLAADLTGLAGATINALVLDNQAVASLNVSGSGAAQALNVTSGAMLFTLTGATANTAYSTILGGFDGGITVGSTNEYVISVINPNSSSNLTSGSTTLGSTVVTVASTAGLEPGMPVFGAGIPTGAKVVSITDATHFVLNVPSTLSASSQTYQYATLETLTATISSPLTSAADITKSGRGTLVFTGANTAGGGAYKTTINEGALEIMGLGNIGGTTGGLVFAGGTLRLSAAYNGDDISQRAITFLAGGGTIDTNGINLALANAVGSGPGGLTKTGAGNLTLNAAATYAGATTVLEGTLTVGANNATGAGGDLNIGGGATLDVSTYSITAGTVTTTGDGPAIQGSGTITASGGFVFNNTGDLAVGAVLAGSSGLLKTQNNVLTLSGASTFSGPVEVQGGTLAFDSITNVGGGASALGSAATAQAGIIHMGAGSAATTLLYNGAGSSSDRTIGMQGTTGGVTLNASGSGALSLGGAHLETAGNKTLTLRGASDPSLANALGVIRDDGLGVLSVVKTDANTWELNGSNLYSGATSVDNGILRISAAQTMAGALNFGSSTSITTAGTLEAKQNASFGSLTVQTNSNANTSHLVIDSGKTVTITGNVAIGSGTGTLTTTLFDATGGGTLAVDNQASSAKFRVGGYTGSTSGAGNIASADLSGLASLQVSLNTTNGVFGVSNTSNTNVSGVYAVLQTAHDTTVTAATLSVGDGGQYNNVAGQINQLLLGAGTTIFNVNTVNIGTGGRDLGSFTFQGVDGTLKIRAADGVGAADFNMGTGTATTGVVLTPGNRNTFDVTGHVADLLFDAMAIGTQNARTGGMETFFAFDTGTLTAASLTMGSKTATGSSINVMNLGGGTVTIGSASGTAATLASNTNSSMVASVINVTGGTVTFGAGSGAALSLGANNTNASGSATGSLNISGGSVTLATTGATAATLATGTAGTSTGSITVNGGTLTVQGAIVRGAGGATRNASVTLSGGTLDMGGSAIGASGNEVILNAQAGTLSGLGELNGGGVFDKITAGTLALSDGNTYTGGTTVTGGTLLAMNTSGSATGTGAVTVLTTATLGGTGSVAGNVQVNGGGILTAGDAASGSYAQLTIGGTLTLDAASIFRVELGGATANDAAAVMAEMNTNGNLSGLTIQASYEDYQAGVTLHDSVNVTGGAAPVINGTVQVSALLGGYTPQYGDIFDLLDWTAVGGVSGTTNFDFSGISLGAGLGFNTDLFASNGIIVVVPEPSRMLLLALGLLAFAGRRRRC